MLNDWNCKNEEFVKELSIFYFIVFVVIIFSENCSNIEQMQEFFETQLINDKKYL